MAILVYTYVMHIKRDLVLRLEDWVIESRRENQYEDTPDGDTPAIELVNEALREIRTLRHRIFEMDMRRMDFNGE